MPGLAFLPSIQNSSNALWNVQFSSSWRCDKHLVGAYSALPHFSRLPLGRSFRDPPIQSAGTEAMLWTDRDSVSAWYHIESNDIAPALIHVK